MNTFKVGDWVRTPHRGIFQIQHEIELASWEITLGGRAEPWQPKEGEWCWFYEEGNPCCPLLKKFERLDINNYPTPFNMVRGFKYCEPFIGELPSFLKG